MTSNGGGTSALRSYPFDLLRLGVDGINEIIIVPPTLDRRVVSPPSSGPFSSASGYGDSGIDVKRALSAGARVQTAVGLIYTAPTGFPTGPNGFGSGGTSYSLSYMINYAGTRA